MSGKFSVGVSGFSYASWKGKFYPKDLAAEDFLKYFSERLNSVEINSSFYAAPRENMVKGWAEKTGKGFKFAFKAPRKITHIGKLNEESERAAGTLSNTLEVLEEKRGPILFQLPPFLRQNLRLLENFLTNTKDIPDKVFEFRHESWLTDPTFSLLEKYDSGFCIAETEDLEPVLQVTGGIAYFRLRKDSYEKKSIEEWKTTILKTSADARESFVYLRHDETGANAILAEELKSKL